VFENNELKGKKLGKTETNVPPEGAERLHFLFDL